MKGTLGRPIEEHGLTTEPEKKFDRITRPATVEERKRHAAIREKVMQEFPPAEGAGRKDSPPGRWSSKG
jgi:hypothetical protein